LVWWKISAFVRKLYLRKLEVRNFVRKSPFYFLTKLLSSLRIA
jgi:hypothetical protein